MSKSSKNSLTGLGQNEKSPLNPGLIRSGLSVLGSCGFVRSETIIPTTRQKMQAMAENHMYETS